jgi:hypothetical protein
MRAGIHAEYDDLARLNSGATTRPMSRSLTQSFTSVQLVHLPPRYRNASTSNANAGVGWRRLG